MVNIDRPTPDEQILLIFKCVNLRLKLLTAAAPLYLVECLLQSSKSINVEQMSE